MHPFLQALLLVHLVSIARSARCTDPRTCFPVRVGELRGYVVSGGTIAVGRFVAVQEAAFARSYALNARPAPAKWSMNVLVLDHPSGRVLIDTALSAVAAFPGSTPGALLRNMRANNLWPASVRYVLLTHAHTDHATGLRTNDGRTAFPNATVLVGRAEHEFWIDPKLPYPSELFPEDVFRKFFFFFFACDFETCFLGTIITISARGN